VRASAVPLVDAFNLSDFVVGSPFGRYDGDIYTHYFEKVKRARTCSRAVRKTAEAGARANRIYWCQRIGGFARRSQRVRAAAVL